MSVHYLRGQLENLSGEIIKTVEKTASSSNENAAAEVTKIRFLVEPAFEQLQGFTQSQVNDRVQRLALDLLPGKTGIVLEQDHVAWQTIPKNATALFALYLLRTRDRYAQAHLTLVGDVVAAY